MREGRQLVRNTRPYMKEQRWRSWWNLLSSVFVLVGAILVTISDFPIYARLVASVILALTHIRLFVIFHDYMHGAIFKGSRVADIFLRFYGLISLAPASIWRDTHDDHHRNNSRRYGLDTVGSFPVMTVQDYRKASRGERFFYALSRHPLTILFGHLTIFLYGFCLLPIFRNPKQHLDSILAVLLHAVLIVTLAVFRPDVLVLSLLLPIFLASALGSYLFYAQHNFPGVKLRTGEEWDYVSAALESSSYLRMNPVMCWFTANIGYHHVHHLNAGIPFYRLPETMAAFDELQTSGITTLNPVEILRCLRLKLWDPDRDRYVSFAEGRKGPERLGPGSGERIPELESAR